MSSDNSMFSTRPVRVLVACVACRARKVKCEPTSHEDPPRSACKRCQKYGLNCEFKSVAEQQTPAQRSPSATHFQHGASTSATRNWNTYPSSTQFVAQQPTSSAPYMTQHPSQSRPTVLGISTQGIKQRSYPAQPSTPDDDYSVRITSQRFPGPEQYDSGVARTIPLPQTSQSLSYQTQGQGQTYHGTQTSSTYPNGGWDQSQMIQAPQHPYPTPSNVGSTPNQAWYQQYSFTYGACYCPGQQCYCGNRRP